MQKNQQNLSNQPNHQEAREIEGPNERILNQRRLDHLDLLVERHLNEKLSGLVNEQMRQQDLLKMNQIKTTFAFSENPHAPNENPSQ